MGTIMAVDFSTLHYLKNPKLAQLTPNYQEFIQSLQGPTVIDVTGRDPSRTRVIVTLLHGNEPSGLIALHRWLSAHKTAHNDAYESATNIRFIVCSTEAANAEPLFSHRYLEGGKDINRCFNDKNDEGYGLRASLILDAINAVNPEAIIDLHNTSGVGPAFSVSTDDSKEAIALASLFSPTLVMSRIRLGALMEQDFNCPIVTIECGGRVDNQAHEVAFQGISRFCRLEEFASYASLNPVNTMHAPLRLQIKPGIPLSYAEENNNQSGIVLKQSIEDHNFGVSQRGQVLGWINDYGLENLALIDEWQQDVITDYFSIMNNNLLCATNLQIFMATTNEKIATSDCLFYVTREWDPNSIRIENVV